MTFFLFFLLVLLFFPGVIDAIFRLMVGVVLIIALVLGVDKLRVRISSPMELQTESQTGYKSFNLKNNHDFNSYQFRKTISSNPFILSGGIPINYSTDMPESIKTSDEKISSVSFKTIEHIDYLSPQCIIELQKFNANRQINISELKNKFKQIECKTDNCKLSLVIKDFKIENMPDFTCKQIKIDVPIDINCQIDRLGTKNGECLPITVILKSAFFFGYERQSALESMYLQKK